MMDLEKEISKPKVKRVQWDQSSMNAAILAVLECKLSENRAAKVYVIPRQTLRRHLSLARKSIAAAAAAAAAIKSEPVAETATVNSDDSDSFETEMIEIRSDHQNYVRKRETYRNILNESQEQHFIEILLDLEKKFFVTLTPNRLVSHMIDYCEHFAIANNLVAESDPWTGAATGEWLRNFQNRNPRIFLQGTGPEFFDFLDEKLQPFYQTLKTLLFEDNQLIRRKIPADHIFSTTQLEFRTSEDKLVTVFVCVNASGFFVPPMFVFPLKLAMPQLLDDGPTASIGFGTMTGSITIEAYRCWFDHFLDKVQPKHRSQSTLILLDSTHEYVQSLAVILKGRKHNTIFLSVPQNCSRILLPLNVTLTKTVRSEYEKAVRKWQIVNPERLVSESDIAELFCTAYAKGATLEHVYSGFRQTGIHPFNPGHFLNDDLDDFKLVYEPLTS